MFRSNCRMKKLFKACYMINISLVFISCSFINIDETDSLRVKKSTVINSNNYPEINSSVLMGTIDLKSNDPVVVVACPVNAAGSSGSQAFHYAMLNNTKEFMIYLPEGDYYLYVLGDLNNDYLFEGREAVGIYGRPDKISISKNVIKTGLNITIVTAGRRQIPVDCRFSLQYDYNTVEYITYNGQARKIYSEIFSHDNAKTGWWHPSLFMKAFGANIYLTEKYDPAKIPVLFVHGAKGSPKDFAYFYARLDKSKFQPMFFYYPSGLRLPLLAELLNVKIKDIEEKYRLKKLYIIAHSMGGLVSRAMITNYRKDPEGRIRLYITLATPWSGFESLVTAMKTVPYVLPSWIDVSSQSMFIKTSLNKPIPSTVDYYLFFGKYDKTSREQALDSRVYSDAKGIFGFNTDHDGILSDAESFSKFNEILINKSLSK